MDAIHRIYWIASYPKSGNTWVRLFLQSYVTGSPIDINAVYKLTSDDLRVYHLQSVSARQIDKLSNDEHVLLRPAALLHMIANAHDCPIYLKTHHAKVRVHNIPLIPDPLTAGAVYLVRDPRGVLLSWSQHLGLSHEETFQRMTDVNCSGIKEGTPMWHLLSSWSEHVKSWSNANATVVRYEDLVERPLEAFATILPALGFDVDDQRLAFAVEQTKLEVLRAQEDARGFSETKHQSRFFGAGGSRWQEELSGELATKVVDAFGETMDRFNYLVEEKCYGS